MKHHTFPLAATAVLSVLVLSACGDDEPTAADDPATSAASSSPSESDSGSAGSTPSSSEPAVTETTTEPATDTTPARVYFVGDTPQGPRLFAEVREVEADNPVSEALALVEAGDAADPDYRTLVPADSIESAELRDGFFAIELTGDEWTSRPADLSKSDAKLAVQQLVYTLNAQAVDEGDVEPRTGVDFYIDGEHVTYLGQTGTVDPAAPLDVRALVNVSFPAEGATVSGTFTASGDASSFEATVPWQVRDSTGTVVLDGFSTAEGWADRLYPWQTEVDVSDLPPGTYTFAALTDDPSGGEGGGPTEDTRTIVVE